ncbi:MAG: hypothetical protein QM702_20715 [Rubrivivax sp.]
MKKLSLTGDAATIAKAPLAELVRRLEFVTEVGLGYLGLGRSAGTLSGGEMQRLRLSAQLGSGLTGALYVLDEPTIGLHPRDTGRLIENLRALVDTGSTVCCRARCRRIRRRRLQVIWARRRRTKRWIHRRAGHAGQVLATEDSPTGRALRDPLGVVRERRPMSDVWIDLEGASANNLKDVGFRVPVGRMSLHPARRTNSHVLHILWQDGKQNSPRSVSNVGVNHL